MAEWTRIVDRGGRIVVPVEIARSFEGQATVIVSTDGNVALVPGSIPSELAQQDAQTRMVRKDPDKRSPTYVKTRVWVPEALRGEFRTVGLTEDAGCIRIFPQFV